MTDSGDLPYSIKELERMAASFEIQSNGCWQWQKQTHPRGYGVVKVSIPKRVQKPAHRYMYELIVGPIPDGLVVDHLCRNTGCINPSHLEPVTSKENTLRGIGPTAINAKKTHCPKGHAYAGGNLYLSPTNMRFCRTCLRGHRARYNAKQAINNQQSKGE